VSFCPAHRLTQGLRSIIPSVTSSAESPYILKLVQLVGNTSGFALN